MAILTISLSVLVIAAFFGGAKLGTLLAEKRIPGLGKLQGQLKESQKKIESLELEKSKLSWISSQWPKICEQRDRFELVAKSHELKPAPEFYEEAFSEYFFGEYKELEDAVKSTLRFPVKTAEVWFTRLGNSTKITLSGSQTKIAKEIRTYLENRDAEIWGPCKVSISGTYKRPFIVPQVQTVTVLEVIKEPVVISVPKELPAEIQEFLDRHPERDRLRLLETAVEFQDLETPTKF